MQYADWGYYKSVDNILTQDIADKYLKQASRNVDTLTFNRITEVGKLSLRQQEVIKEVVCEQASFLYENEDMLKTYLASYGINGTSMTFGDSWNVVCQQGVAIPRELYQRLASTGLTCRSFLQYAC